MQERYVVVEGALYYYVADSFRGHLVLNKVYTKEAAEAVARKLNEERVESVGEEK